MEIENHNKASFALFFSFQSLISPATSFPTQKMERKIDKRKKKFSVEIILKDSPWRLRNLLNKFGNYEDFNRPGIFLSLAWHSTLFHLDDLKEGFIHSGWRHRTSLSNKAIKLSSCTELWSMPMEWLDCTMPPLALGNAENDLRARKQTKQLLRNGKFCHTNGWTTAFLPIEFHVAFMKEKSLLKENCHKTIRLWNEGGESPWLSDHIPEHLQRKPIWPTTFAHVARTSGTRMVSKLTLDTSSFPCRMGNFNLVRPIPIWLGWKSP